MTNMLVKLRFEIPSLAEKKEKILGGYFFAAPCMYGHT